MPSVHSGMPCCRATYNSLRLQTQQPASTHLPLVLVVRLLKIRLYRAAAAAACTAATCHCRPQAAMHIHQHALPPLPRLGGARQVVGAAALSTRLTQRCRQFLLFRRRCNQHSLRRGLGSPLPLGGAVVVLAHGRVLVCCRSVEGLRKGRQRDAPAAAAATAAVPPPLLPAHLRCV